MSSSGGGERTGILSGLLVGLVIGLVLTGLGDSLLTGITGEEDRIDEAIELIEDNYWQPVDETELTDASIEGAVRRLRREHDDRFSHYFDEETFEQFLDSTEGRFSGIGLTVNAVKRGLRVASVFEDTPAEEAGISAGEIITTVDGRSIAGDSADVATARIKGPPGTEVRIGILNPRTGKERTLTIERANVRIPAVRSELVRRGGSEIAHVNLFTFSDGAHGELRDEIESVYRRGADALVLDLRANGGGLLSEAVLVSSIFVEDGVIVSTSGRSQPDREHEARGSALDPRPMVVLVNEDTASSAEIVAAALEAHGVATVVGTKTFGKGTFQEVIELDGGGALDITVGEFLTADGESLAEDGIEPEIRAKDDPGTAQRDEALRRALRVLADELGR